MMNPVLKDAPLMVSDYKLMVLLVDDQQLVGESVRRTLSNEPNIDFHYCSHADQALTVAEQVKPTVILQDLVMPGVDGLALVRAYRANAVTHDTPVLVLSSREEPKTKSDAFAAGANDYLVKLPDRIELIARLRYHSLAYLNKVQRDEAYRALRQSQQQLLEANLELQRLMNVDGLTGLNNRRRFDEFASNEWQRSTRDRSPLSLIMFDVDQFKPYNDSEGHLAGDEVLKRIASVLRECCHRSADLAARFGGEEFAAVLPGTAASGAAHWAEMLRQKVEDLHIPHPATGHYVTISVGCATAIAAQGEPLLNLIAKADAALYRAKRLGRNRVAHTAE